MNRFLPPRPSAGDLSVDPLARRASQADLWVGEPTGTNRLRDSIDGLSALERDALRLVEVEGASYDEVAVGLGLARDEVAGVVFSGRRKIFDALHAGRG